MIFLCGFYQVLTRGECFMLTMGEIGKLEHTCIHRESYFENEMIFLPWN